MTKLQQVNKIVIKMLNKHENPSETSPLDFEKKKEKQTFWCFVNNFDDVIRVLNTFFMFI
jgi:hypothetical protein